MNATAKARPISQARAKARMESGVGVRTVRWTFPSPKFRWLHPKYKARHKCFYGGRGGAKSHSAARMALVLADCRRMRILCTRQIQVSIAESMYRLLVILIEEMGLTDRFQVLRSEIRNLYTGSVFLFRGLTDVKSMISALVRVRLH